ncbi:MAG TPA: hypothetical protein VF905_06925, partial [Nitrospirota bacterium]
IASEIICSHKKTDAAIIIKDKIKLSSFIAVTSIAAPEEEVSNSPLYSYHCKSLPGSIFVRVVARDPMEIVLFTRTGLSGCRP